MILLKIQRKVLQNVSQFLVAFSLMFMWGYVLSVSTFHCRRTSRLRYHFECYRAISRIALQNHKQLFNKKHSVKNFSKILLWLCHPFNQVHSIIRLMSGRLTAFVRGLCVGVHRYWELQPITSPGCLAKLLGATLITPRLRFSALNCDSVRKIPR